MNQSDEIIVRESIVKRPFEARLISDELRAKVKYFQELLEQKRNKSKICKKYKKRPINVYK